MLMLGERPPRSVDEAVAIGERLSALLMAEYLNRKARPPKPSTRPTSIVTDAVFGNASPLMEPTRDKARGGCSRCSKGRAAGGDRLQRRHRRRPPDHARPRRLGFFRFDSRRRAGRLRAVDLDRRGWHHERRSAPGAQRRGAGRGDLRRGRRAGLQRRQGAASRARSRRWSRSRFRCGARTASRPEKPGTRIVPASIGEPAARAPSPPWPTWR